MKSAVAENLSSEEWNNIMKVLNIYRNLVQCSGHDISMKTETLPH